MFDSASLEHKLDKAAFKKLEPQIREDLLNEQFELAEAKRRTVLVMVHGQDGAGKGDVANRLYEWLDAHYLETLAYDQPTEEERARPPAWRYWRDMPARGRIGIVLGSWYYPALLERATGRSNGAEFHARLEAINRVEAMLDAEGVTVLKLWLELDPGESRRRLKKLKSKSGWSRPVVEEWAEIDTPPERRLLAEAGLEAVRATSTGAAPWHVVPAADARWRDAAVGTILLEALRRANAPPPEAPALPPSPTRPPGLEAPSLVGSLDLSSALDEDEYDERLPFHQERVTRLASSKAFGKRGLICVFEGNDAAGKGGAIQRVRQALDPRRFQVHQIAAPTDEERARPYLWRFWRRLPARGHTAFFDRSWYGRVLVERVEGFASEPEWRRAYAEINDFEGQLAADGFVVVKFWLATSQEEQLRRFQERESVSFKRFKITADDWRNREKWPAYEAAANEMIDRTSTAEAPWTLVEAEDKRWARVKVLETIADRLKAVLGGS